MTLTDNIRGLSSCALCIVQGLNVCVSFFKGDYLPALFMDRTPSSSSGGGFAVGRDWSIMLGWNGGSHVPDARANHVWKALFQIQVSRVNKHSTGQRFKISNILLFETLVLCKCPNGKVFCL